MKQYHTSSDAKSRDMSITLVDNKFFKENQELINKLIKHVSPKQKKKINLILKEKLKKIFMNII
tara:strand:+ start:309 stop:500 length:192 start_codon:yes stop_codon:yes gene_type:complete